MNTTTACQTLNFNVQISFTIYAISRSSLASPVTMATLLLKGFTLLLPDPLIHQEPKVIASLLDERVDALLVATAILTLQALYLLHPCTLAGLSEELPQTLFLRDSSL